MQRRLGLTLSVALLLMALLAPMTFINATAIPSEQSLTSSYYPSYLLLSNFINESVSIGTGVPVPNPILNGLPSGPLIIKEIYIAGHLEPLELSLVGNLTSSGASLGINNVISAWGSWGTASIFIPPYTNYLTLLLNTNETLEINVSAGNSYLVEVKQGELEVINTTPLISICFNATYVGPREAHYALLNINKGVTYIIVSALSCPIKSMSSLESLNSERVSHWLERSTPPPSVFNDTLAEEYYLSLLVLKDDQNPYNGLFAASPSPVYLYSWVRDSSFAAMALQAAGHTSSAAKYWLWLAINASRMSSGAWYTRYDFYTGQPDTQFGIPEYDSEALFEIGLYQYYNLTHNVSLLYAALPALEKVVLFQVREVNSSKLHLMPEDLSVWEDRNAYHFWTQALTMMGLRDASYLLGIVSNYSLASEALQASELLNSSIQEYFWNGTLYCSALMQYLYYSAQGSRAVTAPLAPCADSATILPIALAPGLWSMRGKSDVNYTLSTLWNSKVGGLARFVGDDYHYNEYLFDSSGSNPPWIVTTLFLALYYANVHNYSAALRLLSWSIVHSQHGLLPEAIDPNYGNPLPTTSPLTWSSAMYVLTAIALRAYRHTGSDKLAIAVVVIVIITVVVYLLRRYASVLRTEPI